MKGKYKGIVFLQNAWKREPIEPYIEARRFEPKYWDDRDLPRWYMEQFEWPRLYWMYALRNCKTGFMLQHMFPDGATTEETEADWTHHPERFPGAWIDESTPKCGFGKSSVKLKPDLGWMASVIEMIQPEWCVACGTQAGVSLRLVWEGPMLRVPHPAHRFVTKMLYQEAGQQLRDGHVEDMVISQLKDHILISQSGQMDRRIYHNAGVHF